MRHMRGTGLSTPRPPSHGPSSLPCRRPPGRGTWLPVDMLWAERKGLMKGILWEAPHRCRSTVPSVWHCSSFREQKAQSGQAGVCRRPRLSQTWGRSLSERLSLGRSPSPLHQPSRAHSKMADAFCPYGLLLILPKTPSGTSPQFSRDGFPAPK